MPQDVKPLSESELAELERVYAASTQGDWRQGRKPRHYDDGTTQTFGAGQIYIDGGASSVARRVRCAP